MSTNSSPPPGPWVKGDHGSHSVISIIVDICLDASSGQVFSTHRLHEPLDHTTASKWAGGGQEQVAFGLLVEAARREAILGILLMLSQEPKILDELKTSTPQQREVFTTTLAEAITKLMGGTINRISSAVAEEALRAVLD